MPVVSSLALALAALGTTPDSTEDAKLVPMNGAAEDELGTVAFDGTTAYVGAPGGGSVQLFELADGKWREGQQLVSGSNSGFGAALDADGDTLIVGAWRHFGNDGRALVYERSGGTWGLSQVLVSPGPTGSEVSFGCAVAVEGDLALIGARGDDDPADGAGAVYVYNRQGASWVQGQKLKASSPEGEDRFGNALALDGDTAVIAAHKDNVLGTLQAGAAYVFVRSGTTWTEQQRLFASDGAFKDRFGHDVAIQGETIVVGAWWDDDAGADSGSAYVFTRSGTTWTETQKLTASDASVQSQFGASVAISGDRLLVSATDAHAGSVLRAGAVYLFERDGATWTERARFVASDAVSLARLGSKVAMVGDTFLAGAPGDFPNGFESGSAYVFRAIRTESFCDAGDGALASCPCANPGLPDTGCDIQQGTGGVRLDVLEQQAFPSNRVTWTGTGFPPTTSPTSLVIRAPGLDASSPVVFGDGLRCIGTPLVRLDDRAAAAGTVTHVHGHGAASGTFYYQLWFRNTPAMYCDPVAAFNLSSGRSLVW